MTFEEKQIRRNIERCDNLIAILAELIDSDANQQNTWLLLGEIESLVDMSKKMLEQQKRTNERLKQMVKTLKQLYEQIIP